MKKERLQQLLTQGVPEFMAQVCTAIVSDITRAGLDGVELPTLWKAHAPEKSRAWMRDALTLCRARGEVALAYCGSVYLWCTPDVVDQVQASLNVRFAAAMQAARAEHLARQERAAAVRPVSVDDEHDSWPVQRSLVSASERSLPRNLPVRSVFEWRGAA